MSALNAPPPTLRDRLAALSPRERRFLAAAAAAILLFLLYLLLPGEADKREIELAQAPPAAVAAPSAPIVPPPPPQPPAAAPAPTGFVLYGVMGGGPSGGAAILGFPDGTQRTVRIGREFMPGMRLKEVGVRHAVVATAGGDIRLEFNKAAQFQQAAAGLPPAPVGDSGREQQSRREALEFRMGLEPHEANGRVAGFAIRPKAKLPLLERAGLRPGDVILTVNGQALRDKEKVAELSQELATSYVAQIEFLRDGRRMKGNVEVNKRSPD